MNLSDILAQTGGIQSMARELGVSEAQAASGAQALLPAILGGFKKQAQSGGVEGLGGMLNQLGGGGLLDEVLSPQATDVNRGNNVLGNIFGSKDVSRAVAQNASASSGLNPELLKRMLPLLAMLVAGYMARHAAAGTKIATQGAPAQQSSAGGLGGILGGLLDGGASSGATAGGLGGLTSMLDMDGNGNPLDDIMKMAGKALS